MSDEFYMNLAIKKAWEFLVLTYPNPAVGCVILDENGKILSIKAHKKAGFLHAEPLAILFALFSKNDEILNEFLKLYNQNFSTNFKSLNELENADLDAKFSYDFIIKNHANLLNNATAYVTLEPCSHQGKTPPCANLFVALKFKSVIISQSDLNKIASGGAKILKDAGIDIKMGVLNDEGKKLLEPFISWQSGNFSFFKLAISKNGVATGGIISNLKSRTHAHELRGVLDLLIIGGNSVRTDRPRLDARLANAKAPDVLIYSKRDDFDKTIPLFNVPNRGVKISNSLCNLNAKLIMYEGGENLLKEMVNNQISNLKWLLIYQSSQFKTGRNVMLDFSLNPLFQSKIDDGIYGWYELC